MPEPPSRPKVWRHPKREEHQLPSGELKELLLLVDWKLPLHVVVLVDDGRQAPAR
ncbi:MAG: hypothetical protein M3N32_11595 [Actinomycetota bacterium]|nr:hypothetical protein [Actinomycetota bacterium]